MYTVHFPAPWSNQVCYEASQKPGVYFCCEKMRKGLSTLRPVPAVGDAMDMKGNKGVCVLDIRRYLLNGYSKQPEKRP